MMLVAALTETADFELPPRRRSCMVEQIGNGMSLCVMGVPAYWLWGLRALQHLGVDRQCLCGASAFVLAANSHRAVQQDTVEEDCD